MAITVIGGLAAYWVGSEVCYARSISPKGISTVREFFVRFGEPRGICMVEHGGQSYYEFSGRLAPSWSGAIPSSPPAYIFDEQGRFAGWCRDPGDTPNYRHTWRLQSTNQIDVSIVRQKFGL